MENPELSTWPSPKIIVETDCSDYIIDMISFILLPEEMKLASEIYSQPFEKYLIIVASRSSNLIAYCFDKIDKMCKKNIIYSIKEAHLSRILCIKSFKPSFSEQKELKTSEIPHCFISGGLDHYIKIWSALQGKLLRKIQTENNYISDLLIFQNGIGTNSLYLNYEKTCKYAKLQINEEFSGDIAICVGPPKSMKIIDIESSNVDDIPNLGNYSVNSIQSIGIFSKGSYFKNNQPKNQIFFATVDKGSTLKVWKIVKRNKFIKCCCIKKIDLLMYWVLSLTSFVHSSNSYKSKKKCLNVFLS